MRSHKIQAALLAVEQLNRESVDEVRRKRGATAAMSVEGGCRRIFMYARDLYEVATELDPVKGLDDAEKQIAHLVYLMANKSRTRANKLLKEKTKQLKEVMAKLKEREKTQ